MRRLNRAERLVKPHWPSELISIAPQPHPDLSYATYDPLPVST